MNFWQTLVKVWNWFSGHKMWISSTALLILKANELQFIWSQMNSNWYNVLLWIFGVALLIGAYDKVRKQAVKK